MIARCVYVMGPSGAGKDTVLRLARSGLAAGERIAFAHRYVTRPPDPRHENYVSLSAAEFDTRQGAGLFAFEWAAHDLRYAIGVEVEVWRRVGFTVVISGSRAHFNSLRPHPADLIPVLITAPPHVLTQRLAKRGREDAAGQAERLQRGQALVPAGSGDHRQLRATGAGRRGSSRRLTASLGDRGEAVFQNVERPVHLSLGDD